MIVNAKPSGILSLGREGENQARSIRFDISHWVRDFGPGVVELVHQRSGDPYPYPVVVTQTGNEVLWNITATDTAMVGLGRCELQFYLGGVLAKSENWYTKVFDSISASGDVIPDPEVSWVTEVIQTGALAKEQAARAEAAAAKAEAATVNVPILGNNGNWFVWDKALGEYVDTGVYSGGEAPYIGENGNWYVGQTDTGVAATGRDGKTAYQYAVEGGYTGTEEAFAAKLAEKSPTVDDTLTQVGQAADAAAVGERFSQLSEEKVSLPKDDTGAIQNGTNGQILQTNGDGTTQWVDKPTGGSSASSGSTINQYFYNSLASGKYDMKDGYGTTADIYIAADGTETAISGLNYVATDYIPVSANTTYVAYCNGYALYDREKTFVSAAIDISNYGTIKEFTTEQDGYARITYRGSVFSRLCEKSEIKKAPRDYMTAPSPFFDIRIPCNVDLYGDSNSYGYGLSDTANAWANRLGALLLSMPEEIKNGVGYEMSVFAGDYAGDPKLRDSGVVYMSAYTDKFTVNGSYITAVDVYIDGVQQEQMTASPAEYTCALGYHEIELRGSSGGNNVIKSIVTNKTRSFTNHATIGTSSTVLPDTVDGNVEIVMYGTNDRGVVYGETANNMARFYRACEAAGAKVYFLSPIPTKVEGETDASYVQTISDVISQIPDINYIDVYKDMQLYSLLSAETLYSDKLHLNDLGHKVLFCIVASKLHLAALNSIFDE